VFFCLITSFSVYAWVGIRRILECLRDGILMGGSLKTKYLYTIASYIFTMVTTIQVSEQLVNTLKKRKQYCKESYEEVIWDLVEDTMELSEESKKAVEKARAEIKAGKFYTHEQVKKKLRL